MIAENLGNLVNIQTGKLDANASSVTGSFPFFTCAREPLKIDNWKYNLDAVLIAGNGDLNVKHYTGKFDAYQRTYILDVSETKRLDTRYLFHFMDTYLDTLRQQSIGGIIKYIKLGMLKDAIVPLPPLAEQKRIAAILDQADALRRLRKRALDKLGSLGQSIFYDMFGDPGNGEYKGDITKLSCVADLINGDRSKNYPSGDDLVEDGILFLNTKNIVGSQLDLTSCNFITDQKFESLSRGKLKRHDLVITLRGTLAQCAEFDCEYDTGFINAQMMIIRPSNALTPIFLQSFISHPRTQSRLLQDQSGSAVPQLTAKQIGELMIPIPPLSDQDKFSDRLRMIASTKIIYSQSVDALSLGFASLQQRAFKGEL